MSVSLISSELDVAWAGAPRDIDVLVVDDEPEVQAMLRHLLQSRGLVVETAGSAEEAREIVLTHAPRVILLDLMMPNVDGELFLQFVRVRFPPGVLPVIVVTSSRQRSDLLRCLETGANDFMCKPVDMEALAARIAVQISIAKRSRELERLVRENGGMT